MKKKLSLSSIKVKSFVTTIGQNKAQKIMGGNASGPIKTCDNVSVLYLCSDDDNCNNNTQHPCSKETEDRNCLDDTAFTCPVESNGAFCPA